MTNNNSTNIISIKSKIGVEFRRYALKSDEVQSFKNFKTKIQTIHQLEAIPFDIFYFDHEDYLLPINNDENLAKTIRYILARSNTNNSSNYTFNNGNSFDFNNNNRPLLKLFIEKEGVIQNNHSFNKRKKQNFNVLSNLISPSADHDGNRLSIGMPEDFRQVSSIIDVDTVPKTCRRVRLVKRGTDKPLGFYIRDGTYKRATPMGFELVCGIFISKVVPGGLAESTGLLAVNDEILEVNGIVVTEGKTLDQVTEMMLANISNLIITIRPANEHRHNIDMYNPIKFQQHNPHQPRQQHQHRPPHQIQQQAQQCQLNYQQDPRSFQPKIIPHHNPSPHQLHHQQQIPQQQYMQHPQHHQQNTQLHQHPQQHQSVQYQQKILQQRPQQQVRQIMLRPPHQHNHPNQEMYQQYQLHQHQLAHHHHHQQQQQQQQQIQQNHQQLNQIHQQPQQQRMQHQFQHHNQQQHYPVMYSRNQSTGSISDHDEDEIKEYLPNTS